MQQFLDGISQFWFLKEVLHDVLTLHNRLHLLQWEHHPSPQHTRTHRADRLVDDRQKTVAPFVHRAQQFKASHCELIHPHITVLLYLTDASDVGNVRVQRLFQIIQHCTCCHDAILQMLHPITLQVLRSKVREQLLSCCIVRINPIVQFVGKELIAEVPLKHRTFTSFKQHLLG